jgi:aryl-alcohol dehydrogenase-like predicted oxidoreductase
VVHELIGNSELSREQVVVVTKAGYIQGPDMEMVQASESEGKAFSEVTKVQPGFWHCISPDFLRHQVAASTRRLGTKPDIFLLHNPEYFLTHHMRQQQSDVGASPPAGMS